MKPFTPVILDTSVVLCTVELDVKTFKIKRTPKKRKMMQRYVVLDKYLGRRRVIRQDIYENMLDQCELIEECDLVNYDDLMAVVERRQKEKAEKDPTNIFAQV